MIVKGRTSSVQRNKRLYIQAYIYSNELCDSTGSLVLIRGLWINLSRSYQLIEVHAVLITEKPRQLLAQTPCLKQ